MTRDTRLRDCILDHKESHQRTYIFFIFFGEALTTAVQGFSISSL